MFMVLVLRDDMIFRRKISLKKIISNNSCSLAVLSVVFIRLK